MLLKLAAYERQNQLDVALQEIGKIERTLFLLDWLEIPELRRRFHAGLNNSEQRLVLTQAIYTFRQGRIIDRSHQAQQYRASGLNLVIAAIVYWNTTLYGRSRRTPPTGRRIGAGRLVGAYLADRVRAHRVLGRLSMGKGRRLQQPKVAHPARADARRLMLVNRSRLAWFSVLSTRCPPIASS